MSCTRCGDTVVHGAGDRFQIRAWDFTESSGAFFEGRLCAGCWNDLLEWFDGDPVGDLQGVYAGGEADV